MSIDRLVDRLSNHSGHGHVALMSDLPQASALLSIESQSGALHVSTLSLVLSQALEPVRAHDHKLSDLGGPASKGTTRSYRIVRPGKG